MASAGVGFVGQDKRHIPNPLLVLIKNLPPAQDKQLSPNGPLHVQHVALQA